MKFLIALNFAVGLLLTISCVAGEVEFFCWLPLVVLLPAFFLLAFINLVSTFFFWKEKHFWAFLPISTYLLTVALFFAGYVLGADFFLKDTPCRPNTYFTEQTKSELTGVANRLLVEYQDNKKYQYPPKIPSELGSKLDRFRLSPISIDRQRQVVVVGYYHNDYHHYGYIYSKNGMTNLPAKMQEDKDLRNLGDNWYFSVW